MSEALMEVSDFLSSEFELDISADTLRKSRDRIFLAHVGRAIDMLTLRRMSFEELTSNHSRKNDIVDGAMKVFEKVKFGRVYLYPSVAEVLDILGKITLWQSLRTVIRTLIELIWLAYLATFCWAKSTHSKNLMPEFFIPCSTVQILLIHREFATWGIHWKMTFEAQNKRLVCERQLRPHSCRSAI